MSSMPCKPASASSMGFMPPPTNIARSSPHTLTRSRSSHGRPIISAMTIAGSG
jgi:hypothetical protein